MVKIVGSLPDGFKAYVYKTRGGKQLFGLFIIDLFTEGRGMLGIISVPGFVRVILCMYDWLGCLIFLL